MSEVYEVCHEASDRHFAVKIPSERLAQRTELVQRAADEAWALSCLQHDNIVRFEASGWLPDGRPYLAMELVVGRTLRATLERQPRPTMAQAVRWARDLLKALSAVHAQGLVHCDIKPDNVLVDDAGRLKLIDFGAVERLWPGPNSCAAASPHSTQPCARWSLGRFSDTDQSARGALPMLLGTPRYMAPERRRGARADARIDVYGAGRIFEELLQAAGSSADGAAAAPCADGPQGQAGRHDSARTIACAQLHCWREAKDFAMFGLAADPRALKPVAGFPDEHDGRMSPNPSPWDSSQWLRRIAAKARAPLPERRFASALRMQLTLQAAWAAQLEP